VPGEAQDARLLGRIQSAREGLSRLVSNQLAHPQN